ITSRRTFDAILRRVRWNSARRRGTSAASRSVAMVFSSAEGMPSTYSSSVLAAMIVYAIIVVATLVDLLRRPRELLLLNRRWPWILIALAIVPAGFALYLLFGRLTPEDVLPPDAR